MTAESRRRRLPVLLAAALLLAAAPGRATTVLRQSLESLAQRSGVVVRGTVVSLEGHDDPAAHPFRLARVRVSELLDGGASGSAPHGPAEGDLVAVRLPGGVDAAGMSWSAPGVPDLAAGDDVVLFLERVPDSVAARASRPASRRLEVGRGRAEPARGPASREQWLPIGLALGTYRVEGGLAVQDGGASHLRQVGDPSVEPAPPRLALETLRGRVRDARRARP